MGDKEKERFREHLNKFSKAQLVGWISAISFILSMNEVNKKLSNKLLEMFDICDGAITDRMVTAIISNSNYGQQIDNKQAIE